MPVQANSKQGFSRRFKKRPLEQKASISQLINKNVSIFETDC